MVLWDGDCSFINREGTDCFSPRHNNNGHPLFIMSKISWISLWMISGCLLSQITGVKGIKSSSSPVIYILTFQIGLNAIHNLDFYKITVKCWLNVDSVRLQMWLILIYTIYLNCIEWLKERTGMMPNDACEVAISFQGSSWGHRDLFVCRRTVWGYSGARAKISLAPQAERGVRLNIIRLI